MIRYYFGIYEHNEIKDTFIEIWGQSELQRKTQTIKCESLDELLDYESNEWTLESYYFEGESGRDVYTLFRKEKDLDFIREANTKVKDRLNELAHEKDLEDSDKELINKRIKNIKRKYDLILEARDIQSIRILNNEKYYTIKETLEELY